MSNDMQEIQRVLRRVRHPRSGEAEQAPEYAKIRGSGPGDVRRQSRCEVARIKRRKTPAGQIGIGDPILGREVYGIA